MGFAKGRVTTMAEFAPPGSLCCSTATALVTQSGGAD